MFEARVRLRMFVTLVAVTAALIGSAAAQSNVVIEPLRIVVNPTPSFRVEVRVDRDATGQRTPTYFHFEGDENRPPSGDAIHLTVRVSEDAYVYLFNVSATGTVYQFFPNRYSGGANRVRAGETLRVPPATDAGYHLSVARPYGINKVIAVASRRQLDTSTLASFATDFGPDALPVASCEPDCFAASDLGQDGLAQALSIVVTPVPQADWVTDTVQFQIRRR